MHTALIPEMAFEMVGLFQEFLSLPASPVPEAGADLPLQSIVHSTTNFSGNLGGLAHELWGGMPAVVALPQLCPSMCMGCTGMALLCSQHTQHGHAQ